MWIRGHKAIAPVVDRVHQVASVGIVSWASGLEGTKQIVVDHLRQYGTVVKPAVAIGRECREVGDLR
jgi:hypothetical protein